MKKVVAIIQARLESKRLPDKVLLDISGKSMLWHVIERTKQCQTVDQIVVATSTSHENEKILEEVSKCGIEGYAGSEHNVLDRFYQAAKKYQADVIVRITADCPLIHPPTIDKMVEACINENVDYVCFHPDIPTIETGTEAVTFQALEKTLAEASEDYHQEHVTIYIREHPDRYQMSTITPEPFSQRKDFRLTVDKEHDLQLIREIYRRLYKNGEIIPLEKVITLLENHPEIAAINSDVEMSEINQYSLSETINQRITDAIARKHEK